MLQIRHIRKNSKILTEFDRTLAEQGLSFFTLPVALTTATPPPAGFRSIANGRSEGHYDPPEVPAMFHQNAAVASCSPRISLSAVVAAWLLNAAMFLNIFVLHA
ncbi:MAG: hypothetical protein JNG89_16105 [Planctomycetaceae bacterium]|nr:hypothetical protein [Planctomycetaceae bacterium]